MDDEWVDQEQPQRIVCTFWIHKNEEDATQTHLQQGRAGDRGWGEIKTRENKVLEVEAAVEVEDEGSGLGGGLGGRGR